MFFSTFGNKNQQPSNVKTATVQATRPSTIVPIDGGGSVAKEQTNQQSAKFAAKDVESQEVKILTDVGGEYELPDDQRKFIALTSEGILYVSQSHVTAQFVFEFTSKLHFKNFEFERRVTDLSAIEDLYKNTKSNTQERIDKLRNTEFKREGLNLIENASKSGASDIHIRVTKKRTEIWYRINGDLIYKREEMHEYGEKLCTAIYQALSDTSDTNIKIRERQDARIGDKEKLPQGINGVRIATTPTDGGFLMVMRLLTDSNAPTLEALGWNNNQVSHINYMKSRPYGMNIICGPTGSGKSTTLQRALRDKYEESKGRIHLMTVEDPVEYPIGGSVQTSVTNASSSEDRKRKFEDAIRAALRLDPDVIMIGELRDLSSAELAFHAALTGHQVWTTLHANNPIGILDRLISMGLDRYLIADPNNVTGLISQNLVKLMCPACRIPYKDAVRQNLVSDGLRKRIESVVDEIQNVHIRGEGCPHCKNTGVVGRTAVVEVLVPDQTFMDFYLKQDKQSAITYWRDKQDGKTIVEHAISKIVEGLVDPANAEEVVGPLNFDVITKDFSLQSAEIKDAARA